MNRVLVPLQMDGAMPLLGARVQQLDGQTMGTTWQVRWVGQGNGQEGRQADAVHTAVQGVLDLVVAQMSTWLRGSDLDRFNRAGAGSRHVLPEAMADVLDAALWLAQVSGGAFNPAAGALVNAWGFGPGPRYTDPGFAPPDSEAVQHALARQDWRRLQWDRASRQAQQPGGLLLDFSAIAKGHAVDLVSRRLAAMGIGHSLVEVGGELRGQGLRPDGQPWWVDLETPPACAGQAPLPTTRVALHGLCVATSGDYRRVYTHGGQRLPHTLDPRHGQPVSHGLGSVSVVHTECLWADAWSTALTVLGVQDGLALARAHGVAALFVQREADGRFTETLSPAMEALAE
jgi:thiamine biosynthesis lipoprotein